MNKKHRKTLEAIFEEPVRANIAWQDIEVLFEALGAEVWQGRGSRIRVALHDVRAVFHRPHPRPEANRPLVRSVRRFLQEAGVAL
ncbi:MAG: type II toxin-antitoxin system HicA family toxin [Chloroflexi bacterium]|nr:type II toxin-antitoxin system HicA family toxin [Chloroflexota bacterium]